MTNPAKLEVPTIHMNGSSKEALLDGYCDAINALHDAGSVLAKTYPHARDYYVQPGGSIGAAMDQHELRLERLKQIISELEFIAERL